MSDLKDEVERLKRKIDARGYEARKEDAASWTHRTQEDISAFRSLVARVAGFFRWILESLLMPIGRAGAWLAPWAARLTRALWNRFVYIEDEYKNRRLSKRRAAGFVAGSFVFVWFVLLPLLGLCFDLGLYLLTVRRSEVVYLTNSQEIEPDVNVHSVQGCHFLPCSEDNSVYFRIRATLFNELWSIFHGHGLFFPDYVAASVPVSLSQCTITSYGLRLRLLVRSVDIFPDLLTTECQPLEMKTPDE